MFNWYMNYWKCRVNEKPSHNITHITYSGKCDFSVVVPIAGIENVFTKIY